MARCSCAQAGTHGAQTVPWLHMAHCALPLESRVQPATQPGGRRRSASTSWPPQAAHQSPDWPAGREHLEQDGGRGAVVAPHVKRHWHLQEQHNTPPGLCSSAGHMVTVSQWTYQVQQRVDCHDCSEHSCGDHGSTVDQGVAPGAPGDCLPHVLKGQGVPYQQRHLPQRYSHDCLCRTNHG
ncbi:hypothetical protein HaLaN_12444 [Haematococcus lacustris]|uniref:Uncharacterized protein n=1 Tax=Haematococcus lacustris TaxID=44745 RepID=A0A699ZK11_HAELA|nr:hypothetical protein HaLaN_12444 [Haematococcus lacustris]